MAGTLVEHDPFATSAPSGGVVVEHDPFAAPAPKPKPQTYTMFGVPPDPQAEAKGYGEALKGAASGAVQTATGLGELLPGKAGAASARATQELKQIGPPEAQIAGQLVTPLPAGVNESRELLSRCGLQISWRRELGEDPLPRGRSLRGSQSTTGREHLSSVREQFFKPPAGRSGDAVRRPPAVQRLNPAPAFEPA